MANIKWDKVGKWSLILAPILIGGYIIYRQLHPKKVYDTKIDTSGDFPLKVGSKNKYVGQLQDALGVSVDNIFGTKETLPALQKQANKSQIKDIADLMNTISSIEKKDYNDKVKSANYFIDQYKSNTFATLVPNQDVTLIMTNGKVSNYQYTSNIINWENNSSHLINKFQPIDVKDNGDLILLNIDSNGTYNYYAVDATNLSLGAMAQQDNSNTTSTSTDSTNTSTDGGTWYNNVDNWLNDHLPSVFGIG